MIFDAEKPDNTSGNWFIYLTFFIALYLQTMPVPDMWLIIKPKWVLMALAYWSLVQPYKVGIWHAFFLGLLIDLIEGTYMGQNAIFLALVAYFIYKFYQRLRMYSIIKQTLFMFVIFLFAQTIFSIAQIMADNQGFSIIVFLPIFISTLLWPWLFIILQYARKTFGII